MLQLRRLKRLGLVGIPKAEKVEVDEKVGQMEAVLKRRWVGDRLGWVGKVGWRCIPLKGVEISMRKLGVLETF